MSEPSIEAADRRLTLEEFQRMPEEDEHRLELSRGRVVREPRPGARHGVVATELIFRMETWARGRGLGRTVAVTGFLLSVDPPTVRGPDVAFISVGNLPPQGPARGFWKGAPDLAVEVLSPSNSAAEIQGKVLEYLDAGARLVWVIDPETRTATVYRSRAEIRLLTGADSLDGGDVLPGFRLPLAELFAAG